MDGENLTQKNLAQPKFYLSEQLEQQARVYFIRARHRIMALLRYLPANGLPDPRAGPLSTAISSDILTEMNREVEEELERQKSKKYSPCLILTSGLCGENWTHEH